jgi:hypothetical protein
MVLPKRQKKKHPRRPGKGRQSRRKRGDLLGSFTWRLKTKSEAQVSLHLEDTTFGTIKDPHRDTINGPRDSVSTNQHGNVHHTLG